MTSTKNKTPPTRFTEADTQLIRAIMKHGSISNIDWDKVSKELGLDRVAAARLRYWRLKRKLGLEDENGAAKESKAKVQENVKAANCKRGKGKKAVKPQNEDENEKGGEQMMEDEKYEVQADGEGRGNVSDEEGENIKMEDTGDDQDSDKDMQIAYGEGGEYEDMEEEMYADAEEDVV